MGLQTLIKQPGESRVYEMDFSGNMAQGETIASVTSYSADTPAGASALTIANVTASGTIAFARISGGTNGVTYKVTVVVLTSADNILEGEGLLQVKNL